MIKYFEDYALEVSQSYNKKNNWLLSVIRIYDKNGLGCEEKYNIIDLTSMKNIDAPLELIATTYWEEINWEEM